MKRLIKFGLFGVVIAGAISSGGQAFAQLPSVFVQTGTSGVRVGVSGTPRTQVPVTFTPDLGTGQPRTRTVRVNACGFAVVPNANGLGSSISYVAQTVNVASVLALPVREVPTCVNGVPSSPLPSDQANGAYHAPNNSILLVGLPPSRVLDLTYTDSSPVSRFITLNACGFGLTNPPSGYGNISVNGGAPVAWGSLPVSLFNCVSGNIFAKASSITPAPTIPATFRDGTSIWYYGAPFTEITTTFEGAPNIRSATSDRCGGLLLGSATNPVSGTVKVNGLSVNTDTLPTAAARPRCLLSGGNYAFEFVPTAPNFKLPNGQVFLSEVVGLNINGAAPNKFGDRSILNVEVPGVRTVNSRTNACGLAQIRSTSNAPILAATLFTKGSNAQETFSNLPEFVAPRCTNNELFVKVN
ncbi:hypothetical protein [Pseudanabaena minima]|uniref:hypothetical protein n=1 Tax=Pseudanabaena minima TaxID=890415 RepID=UPI003DA861F0